MTITTRFTNTKSLFHPGKLSNAKVSTFQKKCYQSTEVKATQTASEGFKSIGSFHSENLYEILQKENYTPPPLPFEPTRIPTSNNSRDDFMVDYDRWTFLNHGAFGAALRKGFYLSNDWRMYLEQQPLRYFDRDLLPHLAHSLIKLASFVNAPSKNNITLLPNVTSGLNAVLAGYARTHGRTSHCVLWDTTYGSVKKMAKHYFHGRVTEIPFQAESLPKLKHSEDPENVCLIEAMKLFELSLKEFDPETNLCFVLDHVTSNTALAIPIKELSKGIKEKYKNSFVVVDGAHGLLAQRVDLKLLFEAGIDVYLSNGHKWLSAPRGVAFLATANDLTASVLRYPAVQSHGVDETDLFSRFVYDGCRDYSAALVLPSVLNHWNRPEWVRDQCRSMLRKGVQRLGEIWHDSLSPEDRTGMTLVQLDSTMLSPMCLVAIPTNNHSPRVSSDAKRLQDNLYYNDVEVPIKCINERLYARVSCHLYNTEEDFYRLGTILRNMTCSSRHSIVV